MPNQPALEVLGRCLRMKLECEQRFAVTEGLVSTNCRGGEEFGAFGKIESVAMPMKDGHGFEAPHRTVFTREAKRKRSPSDLLCRARINVRTQGAGKKLRAKTNSQERAGKIYALLNDSDFVGEEWISVFFINANWCAQHHQQVAIGEFGAMEIVYSDVAIADLITTGGENGFKRAEVFEVDMPDGRCGFHVERGTL